MINIIQSFRKVKIMVVGDLMMDEYIWGSVSRISPEAPVPILKIAKRTCSPGGAANVVNNVVSLGGHVVPCGVIGGDLLGRKLKGLMRQQKINVSGIIVDGARPTTLKTRIMAQRHQMLRVDDESSQVLSQKILSKVLAFMRKKIKSVDAVIIEDYGKGVVTRELVREVIRMARKSKKIVAVDPKEKHFDIYKGITLITPNVHELSKAVDIVVDDRVDLNRAAKKLLGSLGCKMVLVTQGESGLTLYHKKQKPFRVPAMAREVFDVSGAGDTVIAVFCMAIAAGAELRAAARMANCAAGIVVGKLGVATVSPKELIARMRDDG